MTRAREMVVSRLVPWRRLTARLMACTGRESAGLRRQSGDTTTNTHASTSASNDDTTDWSRCRKRVTYPGGGIISQVPHCDLACAPPISLPLPSLPPGWCLPPPSSSSSSVPRNVTPRMVVAVGISGGVDSAVAALLLQRAGFPLIGVFMRCWDEMEERNSSCSVESDRRSAMAVCRHLNIPFHEVDMVKPYWRSVFSPFVEAYARGETPNPDLACNSQVKFGPFFEACTRLGAHAVATGHYASLQSKTSSIGTSRTPRLCRAAREPNDQSYFLASLSASQLTRVAFPLGGLTKEEVRDLAAAHRLPPARRPGSRGICFVGKRDFGAFMTDYVAPRPGRYIRLDHPGALSGHMPRGRSSEHGLGQSRSRPRSDFISTNNAALSGTTSVSRSRHDSVSLLPSPSPSLGTALPPCPDVLPLTAGQAARIGGQSQRLVVVAKDVNRAVVYVTGDGHHPALWADGCLVRDVTTTTVEGEEKYADTQHNHHHLHNNNNDGDNNDDDDDNQHRATTVTPFPGSGLTAKVRYRTEDVECRVVVDGMGDEPERVKEKEIEDEEGETFRVAGERFMSRLPWGSVGSGSDILAARGSTDGRTAPREPTERTWTTCVVVFTRPVHAVSPGQVLVWYHGERVLGQGTIVGPLWRATPRCME